MGKRLKSIVRWVKKKVFRRAGTGRRQEQPVTAADTYKTSASTSHRPKSSASRKSSKTKTSRKSPKTITSKTNSKRDEIASNEVKIVRVKEVKCEDSEVRCNPKVKVIQVKEAKDEDILKDDVIMFSIAQEIEDDKASSQDSLDNDSNGDDTDNDDYYDDDQYGDVSCGDTTNPKAIASQMPSTEPQFMPCTAARLRVSKHRDEDIAAKGENIITKFLNERNDYFQKKAKEIRRILDEALGYFEEEENALCSKDNHDEHKISDKEVLQLVDIQKMCPTLPEAAGKEMPLSPPKKLEESMTENLTQPPTGSISGKTREAKEIPPDHDPRREGDISVTPLFKVMTEDRFGVMEKGDIITMPCTTPPNTPESEVSMTPLMHQNKFGEDTISKTCTTPPVTPAQTEITPSLIHEEDTIAMTCTTPPVTPVQTEITPSLIHKEDTIAMTCTTPPVTPVQTEITPLLMHQEDTIAKTCTTPPVTPAQTEITPSLMHQEDTNTKTCTTTPVTPAQTEITPSLTHQEDAIAETCTTTPVTLVQNSKIEREKPLTPLFKVVLKDKFKEVEKEAAITKPCVNETTPTFSPPSQDPTAESEISITPLFKAMHEDKFEGVEKEEEAHRMTTPPVTPAQHSKAERPPFQEDKFVELEKEANSLNNCFKKLKCIPPIKRAQDSKAETVRQDDNHRDMVTITKHFNHYSHESQISSALQARDSKIGKMANAQLHIMEPATPYCNSSIQNSFPKLSEGKHKPNQSGRMPLQARSGFNQIKKTNLLPALHVPSSTSTSSTFTHKESSLAPLAHNSRVRQQHSLTKNIHRNRHIQMGTSVKCATKKANENQRSNPELVRGKMQHHLFLDKSSADFYGKSTDTVPVPLAANMAEYEDEIESLGNTTMPLSLSGESHNVSNPLVKRHFDRQLDNQRSDNLQKEPFIKNYPTLNDNIEGERFASKGSFIPDPEVEIMVKREIKDFSSHLPAQAEWPKDLHAGQGYTSTYDDFHGQEISYGKFPGSCGVTGLISSLSSSGRSQTELLSHGSQTKSRGRLLQRPKAVSFIPSTIYVEPVETTSLLPTLNSSSSSSSSRGGVFPQGNLGSQKVIKQQHNPFSLPGIDKDPHSKPKSSNRLPVMGPITFVNSRY